MMAPTTERCAWQQELILCFLPGQRLEAILKTARHKHQSKRGNAVNCSGWTRIKLLTRLKRQEGENHCDFTVSLLGGLSQFDGFVGRGSMWATRL